VKSILDKAREERKRREHAERNGRAKIPATPDASTESMDGAASAWPAPLAKDAYHGLAGDIVRTIEPHSEADPVALLVQLLVLAGAALGRTAHFCVEADVHYLNEFAVLVGATGKARKGVSFGHDRRVLAMADPEFVREHIQGGLSSGEGLIWAVRDPIKKQEAIKERGRVTGYQQVEEDPGVSDKRLLCHESEFATVLRRMEGQGNTLSALLRQAWESGNLRTLTKQSPVKATGAHVGLIAHITCKELRRYLTVTEQANGFGNRICFFAVRRSKKLPDGGKLEEKDLKPLGQRLGAALTFGKKAGALRRDEKARALWHAVYEALSDEKPGLAGCLLARSEAHVMRWACLYAVLDSSNVIKPDHLNAALALWDYVEDSVRYIFGDTQGDPLADQLLRLIRASGATGISRGEMFDACGRHESRDKINDALGLLFMLKLAHSKRIETDGRPEERWFLTQADPG
jgi:hypothetical protein